MICKLAHLRSEVVNDERADEGTGLRVSAVYIRLR
jgi:hypothetical protein